MAMDLRKEDAHSSEEDPADIERAELAEVYGTPPTRLNSIKPLRKLASKFPYRHILQDTAWFEWP